MSEHEEEESSATEAILRRRENVIKEIISTEEIYVSRLKSTLEVFVYPLKELKILDPLDIQKQFDILENLYELHAKYANDESQICFDFLSLFDDVSRNSFIYSQYLVNYEAAMQRRGHLLTTNKKFAEFLEKSLTETRIGGQGLESLLILPVQRIPRYRLLLEQLIKYTPTDHVDYDRVENSLAKICEVAHENNEAIRARENKKKIMDIMMSIEQRSRVDLLDDETRKYIKDGSLLRQCRRAPKEFHFWLLSDKLLYGQRLPLGNFTLHREIGLSKCYIRRTEEHGIQLEGDTTSSKNQTYHSFEVMSPAKSFVVHCSKESERDEWMEAISGAIEKQRERLSREMGAVAPIWTPDNTSAQCLICDTSFTIFNRRHHCRHCGLVVCDSCSSNRYFLPYLDPNKPVRVCTQCFDKLDGDSNGNVNSPPSVQSKPSLLQKARSLSTLGIFSFNKIQGSQEAEGVETEISCDANEGRGRDSNGRHDSFDSEISTSLSLYEQQSPIFLQNSRRGVEEEDLDDFNDYLDQQQGIVRRVSSLDRQSPNQSHVGRVKLDVPQLIASGAVYCSAEKAYNRSNDVTTIQKQAPAKPPREGKFLPLNSHST